RALSLSSAGAHRDLHSFPTRRSSDLRVIAEWLDQAGVVGRGFVDSSEYEAGVRSDCAIDLTREQGLLPNAGAGRGRFHGEDVIRSEEHTSELQSLTNLVCRLLLEKKK